MIESWLGLNLKQYKKDCWGKIFGFGKSYRDSKDSTDIKAANSTIIRTVHHLGSNNKKTEKKKITIEKKSIQNRQLNDRQKSINAADATKFMEVENTLHIVSSVANVKARIILLIAACPGEHIERRKFIQNGWNKRKSRAKKAKKFAWIVWT